MKPSVVLVLFGATVYDLLVSNASIECSRTLVTNSGRKCQCRRQAPKKAFLANSMY